MDYDQENIFRSAETYIQWKDENFDVASYRGVGVEPPDVVTIPGTVIKTVAFDGNSTREDIQVCKELNHDYAPGTDISFHVHWYPTTTASGNVKWQINYWISNMSLPTTFLSGTMSIIQATENVAWRPQTATFPNLALGTLGVIGSQIHFEFFRDPSDSQDTYGADAAVATMGYHYQTNSRGSPYMTRK